MTPRAVCHCWLASGCPLSHVFLRLIIILIIIVMIIVIVVVVVVVVIVIVIAMVIVIVNLASSGCAAVRIGGPS